MSFLLFWYDTLQPCASISVSKLYNFHLPYLVTFVVTLFFWFFQKYLGIPVLTKNFVKICLFVSWGRPQFLLFYLNFRPLLHPKYMNILIKVFPQRYRYGKYLSFATFDTPVTVLGDEQFVFPCKVFFLRQTTAEEVLSMRRNQNWSLFKQNKRKKYLTNFKHLGSSTCSHFQIQSPALCWPHVSWDWIWTFVYVEDPKCLKFVRWVK